MNRVKKEITIDKDFLKNDSSEEHLKSTQIIICGICGKMGQVLAHAINSRLDCSIAAGIDRASSLDQNVALAGDGNPGYKVFSFNDNFAVTGDVIVDFSHPDMLEPLLKFSLNCKIPLVICTTGFSEEQINQIHCASRQIPIFFSGNMSLGINLLIELSKKAARVLGEDFDIEIIEKHHNQKIDAPSGTALMIADGISVFRKDLRYIFDRHKRREKRKKNEIGIHSIRGGTIVGEHEVIFAGKNENITISHSAQSKEIFALGAINAAKFIAKQSPGLYSMTDLLN